MQSKKQNGAQSAQKNGKNNANKLQVTNKRETATQKATKAAEREKERERKAAEKAAAKAQRAKERAEKLAKQKAETAARHEAAKSACSYNFYGVINAEHTATAYGALKHFFIDMQSACGGAILLPLAHVIGSDKREFAERYADKLKARAREKGTDKFTAFLVWSVLWEELKQYTRGEAAEDKATAEAIDKLRKAAEKRAAANKAAREAKAAAKAGK